MTYLFCTKIRQLRKSDVNKKMQFHFSQQLTALALASSSVCCSVLDGHKMTLSLESHDSARLVLGDAMLSGSATNE